MECFDVIVLGTGAAGLTAAISAHAGGASVGLFEKADTVGGTSAWSGGMVWIPNNPHMPDIDAADSRENALTYLESLSHGTIEPLLAEAFVDGGPEMVRFIEAESPVVFEPMAGFPDYHPERPGGMPGGGRSLECPMYPFDELGEWQSRVTVGYQLNGNITMAETPLGRGAPNGVPAAEMERRRIHDERGAGQGLVGRLLRGCLDRGIEPRTGMRATHLLTADGRVSGVRFDTADGPIEIGARAAVVLATGGFEWNPDLVRAFTRGPLARAVSVPTNTGDGLVMSMRIGAALGNMREAWWVPTIDVPHPERGTVAWQVNGERSRPHCIMVNARAQRFTNEAANYNAFGAAFHFMDTTEFEYVNHPCWMVFDHHYLFTYGLAGHKPPAPTPDWMIEAPTLDALGVTLGLDRDTFAATMATWNADAARGEDPQFHRGRSVYDRYWGDPAFEGLAESTLGPLDTAPLYAVRVRSGTLGTKGGPRTDANAQVLDVDGQPIRGLYAAGNVMASAMGMTYGGGGGTLGPAMVFGFLAGRHAASTAVGPA